MAITKGVDVYTTVAEADALFLNTIYHSEWSGLSNEDKEIYLVSATDVLDSVYWIGVVIDSSQPLAFPRQGYYVDPLTGMTVPMDPTPKAIEKACAYQAFSLISNSDAVIGSNSDSGAESITIGEMTISGMNSTSSSARTNNHFPPVVKNLVRPMRDKNSVWWRAN